MYNARGFIVVCENDGNDVYPARCFGGEVEAAVVTRQMKKFLLFPCIYLTLGSDGCVFVLRFDFNEDYRVFLSCNDINLA